MQIYNPLTLDKTAYDADMTITDSSAHMYDIQTVFIIS